MEDKLAKLESSISDIGIKTEKYKITKKVTKKLKNNNKVRKKIKNRKK